MQWKYYDTNRLVRNIKTNRAIINEHGIIRFSNINKLSKRLQEKIDISTNTRVPISNFSPYINFYGDIFKTDKYILVENISKNYSFFDIKKIYNFFTQHCEDESYKLYLKDNSYPLIVQYKNYYYIINSVYMNDVPLTDIIETGMINIC